MKHNNFSNRLADWIVSKTGFGYSCSNCKMYSYWSTNFCPNCGAYMKEKISDDYGEKRVYINKIIKDGENGEFEKYLIACIRKEDSVQGYYDVINQKFYPVIFDEERK